MKRFFILGISLAFFLSHSMAFSFFADTDVEHQSFSLGVINNNDEAVASFIGVFPLMSIDGFAALYAARQSSGQEVTSEVYVGRLQGGGQVGVIKLRAYTEVSRDLIQMINLKVEAGYFAESPSFYWQQVEFTGGAGNFSDRRENDDSIGGDEDEINFGYLMFLTAEYRRLNSIIRLKPQISLDDFASEFAIAWNEEINDQFGVQVVGLLDFDSASLIPSKWNRSVQVLFTYTPE